MSAEILLLGKTNDKSLRALSPGTEVDVDLWSGPVRGTVYGIVVGPNGRMIMTPSEARRRAIWTRLAKKGRFSVPVPSPDPRPAA